MRSVSIPGRVSCLASVLLLASATLVFGSAPALLDLKPEKLLALTESIHSAQWTDVVVRGMRASSDAIWFLADSRNRPGTSALVNVGLDGQLRCLLEVPNDGRATGLAVTARGVATIIRRIDRHAFLTEYASTGIRLSEREVTCYGTNGVVSIDGRAATVCRDGTVTTFDAQDRATRTPSWARVGTRFEFLSPGQAVIVDTSTAQIVLNDLRNNRISILEAKVPEIDEALEKVNRNRQEALASLPADGVPLGRSVVVMDTAADTSGWYVLIWPYHESIGPAVVKFDKQGHLLARFRCRVPSPAPAELHQLQVRNGYLLLGSVRGEVFVYRVP